MSNGGLYVMFPQLIIDIVGADLWSPGLGLFLTFNGFMNLCGTNIGGQIYDTRGSYEIAFVIAAFLPLIAFLLMIIKEVFTWLIKGSASSANPNSSQEQI
ncbi:Monocarboxylate transporter 14 [Schistosoma japonicum]|nr:Monocarboxylate transporter 14 [Schistosoma japonicum]